MSEDRKIPTAGFWITVALVAVLAGYVLSIGPVVWLEARGFLPDAVMPAIDAFYTPMDWLPKPVGDVLHRYEDLWR